MQTYTVTVELEEDHVYQEYMEDGRPRYSKPYMCPTGYLAVHDKVEYKPKRHHRLVWEAYNGPIPPGHHIHHIDHVKVNNNIKNLQLVKASDHNRLHSKNFKGELRRCTTCKEWKNRKKDFYKIAGKCIPCHNIESAINKYGRPPLFKKSDPYSKKGTVHSRSRGGTPIVQKDDSGNVIKVWEYAALAAKELGLYRSNIKTAIKNNWKCGGFYWEKQHSQDCGEDQGGGGCG